MDSKLLRFGSAGLLLHDPQPLPHPGFATLNSAR